MSHARFLKTLQKKRRRIIGLMSGMSMDGVDLALASFERTAQGLDIELEDSFFLPYPNHLKKALRACAQQGSSQELSVLNVKVAQAFAKCVNTFLRQHALKPSDIDAIGSHGQTVAHLPPEGERLGSTLQIGSISVIAEFTGITTLGHFRERDMALGGQGAPLVPLLDWHLWQKRKGFPMALHNLGSISNLSVLSKDVEETLAFDTGPANQLIDYFASRIEGNESGIDQDGSFSAQGKVDEKALKRWLAHDFLARKPPKSANFDHFSPELMTELAGWPKDGLDLKNALRTAVEYSAQSLARAYRDFVLPAYPELAQVYFSGGGVHNRTLMKCIKEALPELSVLSFEGNDKKLVDCKEALAFALLANECLSGQPTTIAKSTGAEKAVISGEMAF